MTSRALKPEPLSRSERQQALAKLRERDTPLRPWYLDLRDLPVPEGRSSDQSGCVYFVRADTGGPVKIGYSTVAGLLMRLQSLQTGNPEKLSIVRVVAGGQRLERNLHFVLDEHRIRSEWFRCEGLVAEILDRGTRSVKRTEVAQVQHVTPARTGRPSGTESERRKRQFAELLAETWGDGDWRAAEHAKAIGMDGARALRLVSDPQFRSLVEFLATSEAEAA